jgi:hypothetical protein
MSLKNIADRLIELGCDATVHADRIDIDIDEQKATIVFDKDWLATVRGFYRSRQYKYDSERRILVANRSVEYQLTRLDSGYLYKNDHQFTDKVGNQVLVGSATNEFLLSYFQSKRYEVTFKRIKKKIMRRCEIRSKGRTTPRRVSFTPDELMLSFHTARYILKRKPRDVSLETIAIERVRACLFSLSYRKAECWEISQDIKSRGFFFPTIEEDGMSLDIPVASYDSSLVSYYKVAKSSRFPSQVFLSYYHILEYHFLRVADETLFGAVRTRLNDPAFNPSYDNVSGLISTIKKYDSTADEKQMLKDVLLKYVPEEEFIEFVLNKEKDIGEKIYSGAKQQIFGEQLSIKLDKGHALANTASLLKHIRNALVHSSDRYSRDECYLPFSESEEIVVKFLPLVQYMAEKIIFATAS